MAAFLPRQPFHAPSSSPTDAHFPTSAFSPPSSPPREHDREHDGGSDSDDALADVSFTSSVSLTNSSPSPAKPLVLTLPNRRVAPAPRSFGRALPLNALSLDDGGSFRGSRPPRPPIVVDQRGRKRVGLPGLWTATKEGLTPPAEEMDELVLPAKSKRNAVLFEKSENIFPASPPLTARPNLDVPIPSSTDSGGGMDIDVPSPQPCAPPPTAPAEFASFFPPLPPLAYRTRAPSEPPKPDLSSFFFDSTSPRDMKKPRLASVEESPLPPTSHAGPSSSSSSIGPMRPFRSLGRGHSASGAALFGERGNNAKSAPSRDRPNSRGGASSKRASRPQLPSFEQGLESSFPVIDSPVQPPTVPTSPDSPPRAPTQPSFRRAFSLAAPIPVPGLESPGLDSSPCADASPCYRPLSQPPLRLAPPEQPPAAGISPRGLQMPGFGHTEKEGKLLDCFSVKDDGLMRISPDTLHNLITSPLPSSISRLHLIDCRFPYEYAGGHLPGAVNLGTLEAVEKHFLIPKKGVNALRLEREMPQPATSKEYPQDAKREVIVFHCEFSHMRAPTLAKHLRSLDRNRNEYPKVFYPEVYILHGGYAGFYKKFKSDALPLTYTPMNATSHISACEAHLTSFERSKRPATFGTGATGRARSFTFTARRPVLAGVGEEPTDSDASYSSGVDASPCAAGAFGRTRSYGRIMGLGMGMC